MSKFSSIKALAVGVGLVVGLGMAIPSSVSAVPPAITTQRVYLWANYFTDRYPPETVLQGQGVNDFTVDIPLPSGENPQLLVWTTLDAFDDDCDIDRIWQIVESAPPEIPSGLPLGGMSGGPLEGSLFTCGGTEVIIDGHPYLWMGTAGNYFMSVPGSYVIRSDITDLAGNVTSSRFTINVIGPEPPLNHPPVAVIAPLGPVHPGVPVVLDGIQSYDPDSATAGDMIAEYHWTVSRTSPPPIEVVGGANGPLAPFVFPIQGTYQVSLAVIDSRGMPGGANADVSTFNTPPVADAGMDITLTGPGQVELPCYVPPCTVTQANRSYDPDGDPITYRWVLIFPSGTESVVSNGPSVGISTTSNVTLRLHVCDNFGVCHSDEVIISVNTNRPPHANFSIDALREVGEWIEVDGKHSGDPDGDPLTYRWALTSVPPGSAAVFEEPTAIRTRFFADVAGTYVVTLVVNDGQIDSPPQTAPFVVVVLQTEAIVKLQELITFINGLSNSEFKKKDQRSKFVSFINAVILEVTAEHHTNAIELMRTQLFVHVDGCYVNFPSVPDDTDWLINCPTQRQAMDMLWLGFNYTAWNLHDGEPESTSPVFDVNPSTAGNSVNPIKDVEFPLAVFSNADFYAPLMLEPINPNPHVFFGVGSPRAQGFNPKIKDVNGDGVLDLVVMIRTAEAGIVCGGGTEVSFRGEATNMQAQSTGVITLKGCK